LAGVLGVLGPWRGGAVALLALLALATVCHARGVDPVSLLSVLVHRSGSLGGGFVSSRRAAPLPDLLACVALLAYVAGHARLVSIHRAIFPRDPRQTGPVKGAHRADGARRRPLERVTSLEVALLLASMPIFGGLAALLLFWLVRSSGQLNLFAET